MTSLPQKDMMSKEEKMKKTLEESLARGDFYSALQMYKTYARRREKQEDFLGATQLYIDGAQLLVEQKHTQEATDLLETMIEMWKKTPKASSTSVRKHHLRRIYKVFPAESAKLRWIKRAIEWSKETSPSGRKADPLLYRWFAMTAKDCELWSESLMNFLYADSPEEFASTIVEYSRKGYKSERDLIIVRTLLKILSLGKLGYANKVYVECIERVKQQGDNDVLDRPLMNFIKFVLLTLERDAAPLYKLLTRRYEGSLLRDEELPGLADAVFRAFYQQKMPGAVSPYR